MQSNSQFITEKMYEQQANPADKTKYPIIQSNNLVPRIPVAQDQKKGSTLAFKRISSGTFPSFGEEDIIALAMSPCGSKAALLWGASVRIFALNRDELDVFSFAPLSSEVDWTDIRLGLGCCIVWGLGPSPDPQKQVRKTSIRLVSNLK